MGRLRLSLCVFLVACGGGGAIDFDGDGIPDASDCAPEDPHRGAALDAFGDGIDQNCDGTDGTDADGDGHAADDTGGTDCDDTDDDVHPDAAEVCDGADNDCDGEPGPDEGDGDGDGARPCGGDCDDSDPDRLPGQEEACNGIDDDCDGYVPSNEQDLDGDGTTPCGGDCNDAVAEISPAGVEACNGFDDDCDGALPADEQDADGDSIAPCEGDCDDSDAATFPGNGVWDDPSAGLDGNCDGLAGNDAASATVSVSGADEFDHAGIAACAVGDIDGDGLADVMVGGNLSDSAFEAAGEAWFLPAANLLAGGATSVAGYSTGSWTGEVARDFAGYSIAPAGDVDGDGLPDVLVGAYGNDSQGSFTGATYLLRGADVASGGGLADAWAIFQGEAEYDESGWEFDGLGDLDGDGLDDLLFTAYDVDEVSPSAGRAYVFFASTFAAGGTFSLAQADIVFEGEEGAGQLGYSAAAVGDVDGGGLPDVLLGAPFTDQPGESAGSAYVFFGETIVGGGTFHVGSADVILRGEATYDEAGRSVSAAGDVDGDGRGDLLVGSRWHNEPHPDGGRGYLLLGATVASGGTWSLADADVIFLADSSGDRLGSSVGPAGDVDGDGLADILIGGFGEDTGGEFAGAVWLFRGATLQALPASDVPVGTADAVFYGEGPGHSFGHFLCEGGDVNGDGLDDLVIGAWGAGTEIREAGRTYVMLSPF